MTYSQRKILANLILTVMILTAGYVNLARANPDTIRQPAQTNNIVLVLLFKSEVRHILHIAGFGSIALLLGPWKQRRGSNILPLLYAVFGGMLLETVQLLTKTSPITIKTWVEAGSDIGLNIIGAISGLMIIRLKK